MHWLLTRPDGHNRALETALLALGQSVSVVPALVVLPWQDAAQSAIWLRLPTFQTLLFTSINAVEQFACELVKRQLAWPTANYLAIGSATAAALADHGCKAASPAAGYTSEDLLALPQLYALSGTSLLLVTGVGGRGLLAPSLAARGIQVARLDVYRRSCNAAFVWPSQKVDALLVTSLESWHCLRDKAASKVRDCVVIAGSERIAEQVAILARTTLTAASPSDADMLAALKEICP